MNCKLCNYEKHTSMKECPCCCSKCGGEKDSEGWCQNYCLSDEW